MFLFTRLKYKHIFHDVIECLVLALEAKDVYTSGHSTRVGDMSYKLAKAAGIKGRELEDIHIAGHLHDIGKIGIEDRILNKAGKLLPHEWEQIKMHPVIGYKILSKSKRLKKIAKIVVHHHERWDGKGYPAGIEQLQIPRGARIIAVCDSIDAMMSDRTYRKALSLEECKKEILINRGIQFDPFLVDVIEPIFEQIVKNNGNRKQKKTTSILGFEYSIN
ncbi:HD domain-containing protein [Clostridium aestuarii]|uniref:HD domain-containing protein n=1 Tax=Clostridium aestuarii TaxID=338193 RepID=A0ABT4D2R1_9CLOT|nr:HD domain-containing phosphohydrolase [Clostridium aestuarii]MCY6484480.1 HD domain-containing protein [Clostridium aestuarii]